jgi:hypothetical protein
VFFEFIHSFLRAGINNDLCGNNRRDGINLNYQDNLECSCMRVLVRVPHEWLFRLTHPRGPSLRALRLRYDQLLRGAPLRMTRFIGEHLGSAFKSEMLPGFLRLPQDRLLTTRFSVTSYSASLRRSVRDDTSYTGHAGLTT